MSKRSNALAIAPDSYRAKPDDLERYTGPVEVTNCARCEHLVWASWACEHPSLAGGSTVSIKTMHKERGRRGEWGKMRREGSCLGYRPSLWTRILRKVGLRKPVMR